MLYQLPNGKVINITLEEYLSMSDTDLQDLNGLNVGDHIRNPFTGSSIDTSENPDEYIEEFYEEDYDSFLENLDPNSIINNLNDQDE